LEQVIKGIEQRTTMDANLRHVHHTVAYPGAEGVSATSQEDEIIKRIERRISMVTHLPEVNGEGIQILHYEDGQKYEPHHDFFHDKFNSRPENGGQRIATVLMYL
jgi:prolyl 4-hydroxylase